MSLEPAAAAIAGLLILGQELDAVEVIALLLVTLASAGVTMAGPKRAEPVAEHV
jgi:inner membrane transporter RhtA